MLEHLVKSSVLISDNPMNRDNQQETAIAIGYLAGILDGEGSICMSVSQRLQRKAQTLRVTPKVILTNTDTGIIEQCAKCLELLGVTKHIRHTSSQNTKLCNGYKAVHYIEIFGNSRVNKLLTIIAPFLGGAKRERAEAVMRFISQRADRCNDAGMASNMHYNEQDIENIMAFFRLTRSKRIDHYGRILNDYTRDKRLAA